ncbi:MAG TPA: O-antigen ligase family protein [Anaerolineae bacterium]|nr:O-antigen ligase family protein [Anaerolineae bacterium]
MISAPKIQSALYISLLLLALTLPFETSATWLNLGPLHLTQLEIPLLLTLGLAILYTSQQPRPTLNPLLTTLGLSFIATLLITALLAPQHTTHALKASLRTLISFSLIPVLMPLLRHPTKRHTLLLTLTISGTAAATLGLLEIFTGAPLPILAYFRQQPTTVGGILRLTGPFEHANQTAMYLEALLPLTLYLLWQQKNRGVQLLLLIATLIQIQAILLTYSRASLLTILTITILLAWTQKQHWHQLKRYQLAAIITLPLLFLITNLAFNDTWRLRLFTEGDNEWYQANLQVPDEIMMPANSTQPITITITNHGHLLWQSTGPNPFNLGARYAPATSNDWLRELRWPLPTLIKPGETVLMTIPFTAPAQPGQYQLNWDLVHEQIAWFQDKNGQIHTSILTVTMPPTSPLTNTTTITTSISTTTDTTPTAAAVIPDRRTLWRVAWQQWQERPLLGIGLDNFRLTYGHYLGYDQWDNTIHTNNTYIEILVSHGLLGFIPFTIWLSHYLYTLYHQWRRPRHPLLIPLGASILAFWGHGLLDYFLLFNPTAILLAILLSLWYTLLYLPIEDNQHQSIL